MLVKKETGTVQSKGIGTGSVVHTVVRNDGHRKIQVVHRNMVMLCNDALVKELLQDIKTTKNKSPTREKQEISKTPEKLIIQTCSPNTMTKRDF